MYQTIFPPTLVQGGDKYKFGVMIDDYDMTGHGNVLLCILYAILYSHMCTQAHIYHLIYHDSNSTVQTSAKSVMGFLRLLTCGLILRLHSAVTTLYNLHNSCNLIISPLYERNLL